MTRAAKVEAVWAWAFIAPTMLGLIILNFYPAFNTVFQSLCKTGDFGRGNTFVGLANYQRAFADPAIWQSLWNTIKYALIEVPFGVVIALLLAVFLNQKLKGTSAFRTVFFLPMVCAPAAVAMVWKWLYNQQFGLLNNLFHTNIAWISNPKIAWISVAIIGVWSIIGYNMVLFISGLQEIPRDYYEAAEIDGCSRLKRIWHITLPAIAPTVITMFLLNIGSLIRVGADKSLLLRTDMIIKDVYIFSTYVYDQGIIGNQTSYTAAVGMFESVVSALLLFTFNYIAKKRSGTSIW
jgi:multiple sugar transport system permease protein